MHTTSASAAVNAAVNARNSAVALVGSSMGIVETGNGPEQRSQTFG